MSEKCGAKPRRVFRSPDPLPSAGLGALALDLALDLNKIGAQRSGSDFERRSSEMSELSRLQGSEGDGACSDEARWSSG